MQRICSARLEFDYFCSFRGLFESHIDVDVDDVIAGLQQQLGHRYDFFQASSKKFNRRPVTPTQLD